MGGGGVLHDNEDMDITESIRPSRLRRAWPKNATDSHSSCTPCFLAFIPFLSPTILHTAKSQAQWNGRDVCENGFFCADLLQMWSMRSDTSCKLSSYCVLWYGHLSFCNSTAWLSRVNSRRGGNITDGGRKAETKQDILQNPHMTSFRAFANVSAG